MFTRLTLSDSLSKIIIRFKSVLMANRISITSVNQLDACQYKTGKFSIRISEKLKGNQVQSLTNWMNGRRVTSLDLSGAGLNDVAVDWIAAAIRSNSVKHRSLAQVNLSNNQIGDRGAIELSKIAREIPNLRISLKKNQIGSCGAIEFVKSIASGNSQYSVDLSRNRIGNEGAEKLSENLARCRGKINRLDLSHNSITLQGDQAMAKLLPRSIEVTYRAEKISFQQWGDRHPYMLMFLAVFLFPVFLVMALIQPDMEEPIPGLITPRSGPK